MPLIIPTSLDGHYTEESMVKGQLYNLDDDEYIGFQFNPEAFEFSQDDAWSETNWTGQPRSDYGYLGKGQNTFDLSMRYIADPGAPDFESDCYINVKPTGVKADFDRILFMVDRWRNRRPETGMPSRMIVVFGSIRQFTGIISNRKAQVISSFKDMSTREGIITLQFREWEPAV